jgi:hypothetical protein
LYKKTFLGGGMSQLLLVSQNILAQKSIGLCYKLICTKLLNALKFICDQVVHKLVTEQWVPQPIDKVFELFFDLKYLEFLTPSFLHFKIAKVSHSKT